MKVLSVQEHSMEIFKPPMLALFTTNVGSEGLPVAITWQVDAPNEQLVIDVLTCTKVMADALGSVMVPSVYGMPQVLMPVVSLRQGGAVCPTVVWRREPESRRGAQVCLVYA
jgi:alpha-amylase